LNHRIEKKELITCDRAGGTNDIGKSAVWLASNESD
jgi:hypothetical protein